MKNRNNRIWYVSCLNQVLYYESDDCVYSVPIIIARVVNFGSQIPLKNLKANYYGLFNYHITFLILGLAICRKMRC
jgi:hypothetical protein